MKSKLNLDPKVVDSARQHAANIAHDMQEFIERHTTVSTERTIVRLLGVDGVDDVDTPLPNVVVDQLKEAGALPTGAAYWIGNAIVQTGKTPQEIAEEMAEGKLDITKLPTCSKEEASEALKPSIKATFEKIDMQKAKREEYLKTIGEGPEPYIYVIVATGNIYEDVIQAQAAARQGADIIAVIRTTAQSLLDYVPYGPTTEGFGGTYATQENFRIMRKALDEVGEEVGRYIRLCNYSSGMCMPEIAAMGALETGRNAQRRNLRNPVQRHQYAENSGRPVHVQSNHRLLRHHLQFRRGQLPDHRRRYRSCAYCNCFSVYQRAVCSSCKYSGRADGTWTRLRNGS